VNGLGSSLSSKFTTIKTSLDSAGSGS
jgi:hypothetical protein